MSTIAIIQARMGSARFPGKVLHLIGPHPAIWHTYTRTRAAIPSTVVTIPDTPENHPLRDYLHQIEAPLFLWDGDENDVLGRYYACWRFFGQADVIVRVTGDCPFVEPDRLQEAAGLAATHPQWFIDHRPTGQAFSAHTLERAHQLATDRHDREHVIPWMLRHRRCHTLPAGAWHVLDTPADLDTLRAHYAVTLSRPGRLDR